MIAPYAVHAADGPPSRPAHPSWAMARISLFATCRATTPGGHPTVAAVLDLIRRPTPAVVAAVKRIRESLDKEERTRLKGTLPAVVFAADMKTRAAGVPAAEKIAGMSGLCCLDFDEVDGPLDHIKADIAKDPHTAAVFYSPSGGGFKVLVRFADPGRFVDCWRAAVAHYKAALDLDADPARKDVAGLCYLSHDPDVRVATGNVVAFEPATPAVAAVRAPRAAPLGQSDHDEAGPIAEGGRNSTLTGLAGSMRRRGMSEAAIAAALVEENASRCQPPLPDGEVAAIARSVGQYEPGDTASTDPWPEPRPLTTQATLPALDLTTAIPTCLPELAAFIRQTSTAIQVPVELVAPLVLSVASLGAARTLEVECRPGWIEPAPVWVACLAEPGERKSALVAAIARPVYAWQRDERDRLELPLARHAERRRQLEAQLTGLRTKLAKAGAADAFAGADPLAQSVALVDALAALPELRAPELITADTTPEAARDLLARNGEKLAIIAAEGDQLDVLLGRYGDGKANLGLFLAMHAGDSCPAHRVGRDVALEHPAGVLCLCIQPQAMEAMLASPDAVGRGLVGRFLFVKPKTLLGQRELEPPTVSDATAAWWDRSVRRLLDRPWPGRVVLGPDGPLRCAEAARVLKLTPEAQAIHRTLRMDLEPRLNPDQGDLCGIGAFASKLPGTIARIALDFQALVDPNAEAVGADCMRAACAWAPFLLGHFQGVVGDAGDPAGILARKVWRWIEKGQRRAFTAGECYRENRSARLTTSEALTPALDVLEAHYLVRRVPGASEPRRGRPSARYEVNPAAGEAPKP